MLFPSKGFDVASGTCRTCRKPYHRNYRTCTFTDAAEESIFTDIFILTREYCGNKCLPRDVQKKVAALVAEMPQRKQSLKEFRMETCGLESLTL